MNIALIGATGFVGSAVLQELLQRGHDVYHVDIELQRRLRDVQDHAIRVTERIDGFRAVLDKALTVHSALVARRQTEVNLQQNEQVKKISSWAAIGFAPTLVAGIYGMNFQFMPELAWPWGYPFAIGLMIAVSAGLYVLFKRNDWL